MKFTTIKALKKKNDNDRRTNSRVGTIQLPRAGPRPRTPRPCRPSKISEIQFRKVFFWLATFGHAFVWRPATGILWNLVARSECPLVSFGTKKINVNTWRCKNAKKKRSRDERWIALNIIKDNLPEIIPGTVRIGKHLEYPSNAHDEYQFNVKQKFKAKCFYFSSIAIATLMPQFPARQSQIDDVQCQ